jgi:apolipoprotein N-acyltransferase
VQALAEQVADYHQARHGAGQLLTGILRFDAQNQLRNSALLLAEDGSHTLYDKTHLVPFGEYVPWRFIPFIDAIAGPTDFIAGDAVRPMFVPEIGLVLPLICYEAIFPALTGTATERPHFIVNLTNDGWFGHTAGPYQHLAQTRMTAISYGIAVIRVANGGISAAFDGKGRLEKALPLGVQGVFDVPRPAVFAPTLFARFGWLISLALFFVIFMVAIGLDRLSQKRQ